MTTEADHLQIMALSSYLAVPARGPPCGEDLPSLLPRDGVCVVFLSEVTVVYLDQSEGATQEHPFVRS